MTNEAMEDLKKSLAVTIAKMFEWDGMHILDVMQIALEDSNYHTLNRELEKFRADNSLISEMEYCLGIGGEQRLS